MRVASEGVSTVPGHTALQRIPFPTKSAATDFVSPITAALDAEYAQRSATPFTDEATDDMFTIVPFPFASIPGSTARIVRNIDFTLRSKAASQSSSEHSRTLPWWTNPAQLKSTSNGPR